MAKKRNIPHTYVIVFYIVVIVAALTWFVPGGQFGRHTVTLENGSTKEVITENSFQYTQNEPQTWQVFSALFDGFVDKADIIVFILLIGGAFWIMNESKAIDVGIMSFLKFAKKLEHNRIVKYLGVNNIILTMIMLMFSIFGAVYGMSEETIAFIIIFVPLAISMGYDSIVGISICFVAAGLGFAGALLNPFTIGIAQGLSDLPLFSGIEYRFFSWIVINLVGIIWILRYAAKIKKNPKLSVVYEDDKYWREKGNAHLDNIKYYTPKSAWITWAAISVVMLIYSIQMPMSELTIGNSNYQTPILPILTALFLISGFFSLKKSVHFFILVLLGFTIAFLIVGVMGYGWYVMEIATLFFAMGLASGAAMNYSPNKITKLFIDGVKDITSAALVVGLAGGIIVILNNGKPANDVCFPNYYQCSYSIWLGQGSTYHAYYVAVLRLNWCFASSNSHGISVWRWLYQYDYSYFWGSYWCTWSSKSSLRKMGEMDYSFYDSLDTSWSASFNSYYLLGFEWVLMLTP